MSANSFGMSLTNTYLPSKYFPEAQFIMESSHRILELITALTEATVPTDRAQLHQLPWQQSHRRRRTLEEAVLTAVVCARRLASNGPRYRQDAIYERISAFVVVPVIIVIIFVWSNINYPVCRSEAIAAPRTPLYGSVCLCLYEYMSGNWLCRGCCVVLTAGHWQCWLL